MYVMVAERSRFLFEVSDKTGLTTLPSINSNVFVFFPKFGLFLFIRNYVRMTILLFTTAYL